MTSSIKSDGTYDESASSTNYKRGNSQANSNKRGFIELVVILVVAVLVAIIVRTFLLALFFIPTPSMEPTLKVNDKIFVNKLSYKFNSIERGDIVVFDAPAKVKSKEVKVLVKRVIALPGETIEGKCAQDNGPCNVEIYIDGKKLNEPYIGEEIVYAPFTAVTVPANSIFVMGDNRGNSQDARFFDPIPTDTVIGRAFLRIWPISGFGFL